MLFCLSRIPDNGAFVFHRSGQLALEPILMDGDRKPGTDRKIALEFCRGKGNVNRRRISLCYQQIADIISVFDIEGPVTGLLS